MPPENNGVTTTESPTDERGVPLQNLQAEFSRKFQDLESKMSTSLDAINQKLEAFSVEPEPAPSDESTPSYDKREELQKISADPRRYVEQMIQPLKAENERLKKEVTDTRNLTVYEMWKKQEETIARLEGKTTWKELPDEIQNGVIAIVKEKGWGGNPALAMDAYEIYQARKARAERENPDRINRINASTTEGSGRFSGKTPVKTLSRSSLEELASTHPKHPEYKKNMETLQKVQSGQIKVE